MRAYYYDNIPGDQRLPHDYIPSRPVSAETLEAINFKIWSIPVEGHEDKIDAVAKEREYKNRDIVTVSKEGLGEKYDETIKTFFHEHLHEEEEIRYVLAGSGYFDFRESPSDAWIRLVLEPGDIFVLPAGVYHRFTLDEANFIKAMRLFQDKPNLTPHNRSEDTDTNPHRIQYLNNIHVGVGAQ